MRRRLLLILILGFIAIAAVFVYFIFMRHARDNTSFSCSTLEHKPVVVAFGDSLVEGYGAPEQQGFVGPLSAQIGTTILNQGENGDTTGQALKRLPGVLAQHPDIVIVLLGGNDALQQIPQATTQGNLSQILSILQQNHIHIVLVGILGGIGIDPYASMFEDLAKQYDAVYVPNILSGLIGNNTFMYDEIHPNAVGYDKAAEKIYPALNQACELFAGK